MFFGLFLVFVALGYSLLEKDPLMAWLGISFFGLGAIIFLIQILTNVSYLKLSEAGFEERSLIRTRYYKWSDVEGLRQASFRGIKSIYFEFSDEYKRCNYEKKASLFSSRKRGGITSSYTIKTEELLELMKDLKRKSND